MNTLIVLMIAVFIRHSLYRARYFLHMFQLTGYKTGEFRTWLNNHFFVKVITPEHIYFNLVILVITYLLVDRITLTAGAIIMGTFTLFWFLGVSDYREEREKKPLVYTARLVRLAIIKLAMVLFLWVTIIDFSYRGVQFRDFFAPFINTDPYLLSFGLVFVDMFVPLFLIFAAWLTKPVEKLIQNGFKRAARKKLASMPGLKVIAITGSYGKTSTKFVIEAFLKERMKVCVTPGSYNTPMGICKVINNDLEAHHQVLILEMGARYRGNIKELCDIARPDISVITNVGISHMETFGSGQAVAEEKSTLAIELKPGGTLILNGEDENVRQMASLRSDVKTVLTGSDGEIQASDIGTGPQGTIFSMRWVHPSGGEQQEKKINTKLLGVHNVQNILLGAAAAREFGIRPDTIAVAASAMKPVEHRLELKERDGLIVIDDAFNSNPVGARNAIDILASFETGRKILITPGMIELGDLEEEENEQLGRYIGASNLDLVILVGEEQTRPIRNGILMTENGRETDVRVVSSLFGANDLLREFAQKGDVVLYENDLPDTYS